MALFEVWLDKERKFHTDSPNCIPPKETLQRMKKLGYTIKQGGKRLSDKTLKEAQDDGTGQFMLGL